MIEKGKISAFQMAVLMYPTILATVILLVPAFTGKIAGRDMWLSPIWASLVGFLTVYIAIRLNKLYPNQTIIEYSVRIIGTIPGKLLGLIFLFFYLHVNGIVLREYAEFIVGIFFTKTPIIVIIGSMALVCAYTVRGGLEVLARSAQIFVPVIVVLLMSMLILSIPDLEPKNMLPVMEKGFIPSTMGSIPSQGWFSEFFLISFILPYLTDREKGLKWGMLAVLFVMISMVFTNLISLFLFSGLTTRLTYPVIDVARYISIANFLEHLESIVMALWVAGAFVKISVFYYALVLGTAQWLKIKDYRPIVYPIGFLLVNFCIWAAPNLQEMAHFLGTSGPFYLASVQTAIPVVLLVIALIKKKAAARRGKLKG